MELGIEAVAVLAAVAVVAGMLDAIAGGGGLITVPALLLAGLDPVVAVATNKLQGVFGTASATFAFARAGKIDLPSAWPMAVLAAIGAMAGAVAVRILPGAWLAGLVPLLLIGMALYFGLSPRMTDADARRRMAPALFAATVVPLVGFYDGFFGPGAGSFYMMGFVTLLGLGVVRATGQTKLLNLASNGGSLALFVAGDPCLAWRPSVALDGSRSPTPGGRALAARFAGCFVEAGLAVTSGLATARLIAS